MRKLSLIIACTFFVSAMAFGGTAPKSESNEASAVVHVYRPGRVVGFGWIFNLKVEGEKVAKVKNGKHLTLNLDAGNTAFEMNNSHVEMNLESGKHYYLRASLTRNMLLGKPEIIEVTDQQAKKEMAGL